MLNKEIIQTLIDPGNTNIKPGVERMYQALELLSYPQNKYSTIHITGSNGKGSTAAFIESGLIHAGFRVGKFTSPYIWQINECINLNGVMITDDELERVFFILKHIFLLHKIEPSPFEFLTLIMFYFMAEQNIDYLVLEVGMGGLNDCTNVVDSIFSIITNISLEHTEWLGNTLAAIALEKSGIIKSGKTIIADSNRELKIAVEAKTKNYVNVVDKYSPQISYLSALNNDMTMQVSFAGKNYKIGMLGKFQVYNFLCAYEVMTDLKIPEVSIIYAAKHAICQCRLQIVDKNPLTIFDISHNLAGAKSLYLALTDIYISNDINKCADNSAKNETMIEKITVNDVVIVITILKDKDINGMLDYFSKIASTAIFTGIKNNSRGITGDELSKYANDRFLRKFTVDNAKDGLKLARSLNKKMIIVTGSSYLFKEI